MTAQHTQGEWSVVAIFPDKSKGHTFEPIVSILANSPTHGTIRIADIPDVESEDCEEMANARLFAVAPKLLEALKALVARIEEGSPPAWFATGYYRDAKAAIAVAEDRS